MPIHVFQPPNSPEGSLGLSASNRVVPAFGAFRKVRKTFKFEQQHGSCLPTRSHTPGIVEHVFRLGDISSGKKTGTGTSPSHPQLPASFLLEGKG